MTPPIDPELLRTLLIVLVCGSLLLLLAIAALVAVLLAGTQRARSAFDRWMTPDPRATGRTADRAAPATSRSDP